MSTSDHTSNGIEALQRFYQAGSEYVQTGGKDFGPVAATLHPQIVMIQADSLPFGGQWHPFQSLSEEKSNAYFADGIQDEILARLSKISDLKVISRTSTQKYKSKPTNLRDIARQLGVSNILEGSVEKAADQVRITVQLINATTDAHLWGETYDRKLLDTFQVESDIAERIASTLEAKLSGKEKAAINARGTDNAQAYETYLRALALNNSQSDADNARMRDLLREAVGLDPNFAEAWSWLAAIESNRYFFPEESPAQKERARSAAETALRLAPDSADAIGSMGLYYNYVEKNYDEALRWLDRARAIAPNVWKWINATSLVKRRQGKLDETIALQERGADLIRSTSASGWTLPGPIAGGAISNTSGPFSTVR